MKQPLAALLAVITLAGCSTPTSTPATSSTPAPAAATILQPAACHAHGTGLFSLPDPACTPGALNPNVTQTTIRQTICHAGWTKTIRPPENVTEPEKLASMRAYGDPPPAHAYEYDHLISLELGGATNSPANLWPEPGSSPNPKDRLENHLHAQVCDGQITLRQAQTLISRDWVTAYQQTYG